uniref:Uncharacterized protein n=1 Tax=Strigamia maritima TaxID=126957 RepID=T1J2A0_STRMM
MTITLANIINKYSITELINYFDQIPYLSTAVNHYKGKNSNKTVIAKIVRYCETNGVSQKVAEQLDLLDTVAKQNSYEWQVFEFTDPTSYFEDAKTITGNPDLLVPRIETKLQLGFTATCQYIMRDGFLWIRALITNPIVKQSSTVMHAAYGFHSSIIVAKFSNCHEKKAILKAVASALNYRDYNEIQLSGCCVRSLMRLHNEKNNSGYKMKFAHRNPLLTFGTTNNAVPAFKNTKTSIMEDTADSEKSEYLENIFGAFQQPRLQSVQFDIQTPFTSQSNISESDPFHCSVSFKGPSVLEGFREMVKEGLMAHPLPKHVETVRMGGKNVIKLQ